MRCVAVAVAVRCGMRQKRRNMPHNAAPQLTAPQRAATQRSASGVNTPIGFRLFG